MKFNNETKIGIMVVLVISSLILLTLRAGNFHLGEKGYEIKVHLKNIDGLELNAPVRFNGLEKGLVKDIRIRYDKETIMELTLFLNEDVKIHQGAEVDVKNMGLMGEKFIGITDGDATSSFLQPGSVLVGEDPVDFEKLLAKGDEIADNLKEISANLNERLRINSESIDEIIVNVRDSSRNITSMTKNLDERLAVGRDSIDETIKNFNSTSRNLEELSEDLKLNPWKLLYKERESKKKKRSKKE